MATRPKPDDPYPTRLDAAHPLVPRVDPVVHRRGRDRWEGPLDEESLSRFERDGFLWFPGFFARQRVEPFFDELVELARDEELVASDRVIREKDSGKIRSVFAIHEISERFDRMTRNPRVLGMAEQILGGEVSVHQSRINDKSSFRGRGFGWHSDFETWHAEDGMPRMRAVSASILLTDNVEFNGPLMLIPGSHQYFVPCVGRTPEEHWRKSLVRQEAGLPTEEAVRKLATAGGIEAPKGPAGSLLLFECNTLHASNGNMSPWPRSNLFFVYNAVDNSLADTPFAAPRPRPEFLASRGGPRALEVYDDLSPFDR